MPTPATAKWPRPKSEDEWEDMVLDALRIRWKDPNASRNGRRGQRQHGVDLFSYSGAQCVGAQAKNSDTISEQTILNEVTSAEQFRPSLTCYFFVVAGPRDTHIQEHVRLLTEARIALGQFPVQILFFDDVCHELASKPELVRKHWGDFFTFVTVTLPALGSALRPSGAAPVLDEGTAAQLIWQIPEFDDFAKRVSDMSRGTAHANFRFEGVPDLGAAMGSEARTWRLAIGETHETHRVTIVRVAIDVDSGMVSIRDTATDRLVPYEQWLRTLGERGAASPEKPNVSGIPSQYAGTSPPDNRSLPTFAGEIGHLDKSRAFEQFISANIHKVVYLDVYMQEHEFDGGPSDIGVERQWFVLWAETHQALKPSEKRSVYNSIGTEYNVDVDPNIPESMLACYRGTCRLNGYFAIVGCGGPNQGLMGVRLRPLRVEDALKTR